MTNTKGLTLIEIVVAMGIFMVIMTIAVGAFVTALRMQALTSTMKESQQKIRIATEMIVRLSRQADRVIVSSNGENLDLYFTTGTNKAIRFSLVPPAGSTDEYGLFKAECTPASPGSDCATWPSTENDGLVDLLGGTITLSKSITESTDSYFQKTGSVPPTLKARLNGKIVGMPSNPASPFYNDSLNIQTSVVLENIK